MARQRRAGTTISGNRWGKTTWELRGLKEAIEEIVSLQKDIGGESRVSDIQRNIWAVIGDAGASAARLLTATARRVIPGNSSSRGKSGTQRVVESIFSYSKQNAKHRDPGAIVGVGKRGRKPYAPAYIEWHARRDGSIKGMSLATMAEEGKGRWKTARPFFKPAWSVIKAQVILKLTDGYRQIVNYYR